MLDRFEFLVSEAFVALRRNGWMTFACVSTVAVALFLIGGLGYAYVRVNEYASGLATQFEMRVFLKDGTTMEQIRDAAAEIRKIEGVAQVVHIPRDKAWEKLAQTEGQALTSGLENPLPDAFKVLLTEIEQADAVSSAIEAVPVVAQNGVVYLGDLQKLLSDTRRLIRWSGLSLGVLLLFAGGVLIFNSNRMTIVARRREIRIMQWVGASHSTIRIPFLIEGAIQGAFGGLLAAALLASAHAGVSRFVEENMRVVGGLAPLPLGLLAAVLGSAGCLYGLVCSALATRGPVRVAGGTS
ncbi:MAG: permease-like cell division protein FtsX [Fimbriimonadaceae bacterium]